LSKLNTNISRNGAVVSCKDLLTQNDFVSAGIDYKTLRKVLSEVFGDDNCYLVVAASNNAGLRPDNNSPRKLNITDEIDKICDCFFGGQQNTDYYLGINRYENGEIAKKKPVISGCDAHSFDELEKWLGKRYVKIAEGRQVPEKDITWIKAETTDVATDETVEKADAVEDMDPAVAAGIDPTESESVITEDDAENNTLSAEEETTRSEETNESIVDEEESRDK
jgi:hypothetical protein